MKVNESIVKALSAALSRARYKMTKYGKINGFDCKLGYEIKTNGDKLAESIQSIIDLLENDEILQKDSQTVKHPKLTRPTTTEYINKKV